MRLQSKPKFTQFIIGAIAVAVAAIVLEGIIKTGFGALGQTPGDRAWSYVIALLVTWGISGAGSAGKALLSPQIGSISEMISSVASGAFLGFFYAGVFAENNPQVAIGGAVVGGILALVAAILWRRRLVWGMVVAIAGALHGYGFALLVGTQAIDRLVAGLFGGGTIWGIVCIVYLFFSVNSLRLAVQILGKLSAISRQPSA
ncbi:MAG: hypothetical protein D6728_02855 [Cyanobacteria bacterium J055]|nr:MAG: hypothetical protein D6728_02855 [Cyanobacteria bacterium J055]